MIFRPGTARDIPGILQLQALNLVTNLTDQEKQNGFVTTPFTENQLQDLINVAGLAVIENADAIAGYAAAAGWEYFRGRPMFDFMLERFQKLCFQGLRISADNSYEYGPICVEASLRGSDAFVRLFAKSRDLMAGRFTIGTSFINKINQRSLQAHTRKAQIEIIDEFEFNGNNYYGLAFSTGKQDPPQR